MSALADMRWRVFAWWTRLTWNPARRAPALYVALIAAAVAKAKTRIAARRQHLLQDTRP